MLEVKDGIGFINYVPVQAILAVYFSTGQHP